MDDNQRFEQFEQLLTQLLKSHRMLLQHGEKLDLHRDLLIDISQALNSQGKLMERLVDRMEATEENRKMDAVHLQGSLTRLENELRLIRPLLEKALDLDDRGRKIEEFLFKKGA